MSPAPVNSRATAGEPTFLDLGELLVHGSYRHRLVVFGLLLAGTLGATLHGMSLPPQFTSTGKVLVRFGAREKQAPEAAVPGATSSGADATGIADELQVLSNPALHERVALELGVERILAPRERELEDLPLPLAALQSLRGRWTNWVSAQGPAEALELDPAAALRQATAVIGAGVTVSNKSRTKTIEVQFTATDPTLARDCVDAFLSTFQQRHREVYAVQPQETFLADQLGKAVAEADRVRMERYKHIAECGHVDPLSQKASLLNAIEALESTLSQSHTRLAAINGERSTLQTLLETTPLHVDTLIAAQVITNPVFTSLYTQEANLRGQLAGLATEYRVDSTAYAARAGQLRAQIEAVHDSLTLAPPTLEISPARTHPGPNPRRDTLAEQIQVLEREEQGIVASQSHQLWLLDEHERHMAEFIACEPRHLDLQEELTRKESHVAELHSALDKAAIMGLIDRNEQMSNLVVIQEASLPMKPVGPARLKYYLMGIVGSLALALAYILARHLTDRRIRYPSHVATTVGLPLLAVVGEQPDWRRLGKRLQRTRNS